MTTFETMVAEYKSDQLSLDCGIEYSRVTELLNTLLAQTSILMDASFRGLNLVSCPNIVPLYTNAVYNATCETSIKGATWIFVCTLLMSFFGMLCIMFRGAYYPIDYFYYSGADGSKSLYSTSESEDDDDDDGQGDDGDVDEGEYDIVSHDKSAVDSADQRNEVDDADNIVQTVDTSTTKKRSHHRSRRTTTKSSEKISDASVIESPYHSGGYREGAIVSDKNSIVENDSPSRKRRVRRTHY
jgi:hypothetical protein